jgi:hypothetical protein
MNRLKRPLFLLAAMCALGALVSCPASMGRVVRVERVGELSLAPDWSEVSKPGRRRQLVKSRGTPNEAWVHITNENRLTHEQALKHLSNVAHGSRTESRFVTIDGWPALQRHHIRKRPALPDLAEAGGRLRAPREPDMLAVTTLIAVGTHTVRVEGRMGVHADPHLVDEVLAMGSSLKLGERADAAQTVRDLEILNRLGNVRPPRKHERPHPPRSGGNPELRDQSNHLVAVGVNLPKIKGPVSHGVVEQDIISSSDGRIVIVANIGRTFHSTDGGNNFIDRGFPIGIGGTFRSLGDVSLAHGGSGIYYLSFNSAPDGSTAALGVTGIARTVAFSADGKSQFSIKSHAVTYAPGDGIPDQGHIAADPRKPSGPGTLGDRLYEVYRDMCTTFDCTLDWGQPAIVCSFDGGDTWSNPNEDLPDNDFPRVTVAEDGMVYVVTVGDDTITVTQLDECGPGGQNVQFSTDVGDAEEIDCPQAGLDRCTGDAFNSPTVSSAHDGNAAHLFVAWADQYDDNHVPIWVSSSMNSGQNWGDRLEVSDNNVGAERYMPWMCAIDGTAHVGWFDKRAVGNGGATDDLSEYRRGSATVDGNTGVLTANTKDGDIDVSGVNDPACASFFPCNTADDTGDWTTCTVAVAQSGLTTNGPPGLPNVAGGCPKYGDYNGMACAREAHHVFAAWGSGTPPKGVTPPPPNPITPPGANPINLYVDAIPCGANNQFCCSGSSPCNAGLVCKNQLCTPCGEGNEPCCSGAKPCGPSLVCASDKICSCGNKGEPCCVSTNMNPCGPALTCGATNVCECGKLSEPCCNNTNCEGTNVCQNGTFVCVLGCGYKGAPCCTAAGQVPCEHPGLICVAGKCTCGAAGQPCCTGGVCNGFSLSCQGGSCQKSSTACAICHNNESQCYLGCSKGDNTCQVGCQSQFCKCLHESSCPPVPACGQ